MDKISFRKIKNGDEHLIHEWIKSNEFVRFWYYHNKTPRVETINKKIHRDRIDSYIVLLNNVEIGYVQCYSVDGWGVWSRRVKIYNNMQAIGTDYYIGDINYIHKGFGPKMINEFIDNIIAPTGCAYVLITPDKNNVASRRCCEKCGLKFVKEVNIPYKNSKHIEAVYFKEINKKKM